MCNAVERLARLRQVPLARQGDGKARLPIATGGEAALASRVPELALVLLPHPGTRRNTALPGSVTAPPSRWVPEDFLVRSGRPCTGSWLAFPIAYRKTLVSASERVFRVRQ